MNVALGSVLRSETNHHLVRRTLAVRWHRPSHRGRRPFCRERQTGHNRDRGNPRLETRGAAFGGDIDPVTLTRTDSAHEAEDHLARWASDIVQAACGAIAPLLRRRPWTDGE